VPRFDPSPYVPIGCQLHQYLDSIVDSRDRSVCPALLGITLSFGGVLLLLFAVVM
jgi:hypothetical protein